MMVRMADRIQVLLLEPDRWRYRGMSTLLEESGRLGVIGDSDFAAVLTSETPAEGWDPMVGLVAHRLVIEYGLSVVAHLKTVYEKINILVHGDDESLDATAELMTAGASGFYDMTQPLGYLVNAVMIAAEGKLWGPREAVAMMAERKIERERLSEAAHDRASDDAGISREDLLLLESLRDGLTNKEIANRFGLAEVTIKTRLGRLYKRFGVDNRLKLLSAAIREQIVDAG